MKATEHTDNMKRTQDTKRTWRVFSGKRVPFEVHADYMDIFENGTLIFYQGRQEATINGKPLGTPVRIVHKDAYTSCVLCDDMSDKEPVG